MGGICEVADKCVLEAGKQSDVINTQAGTRAGEWKGVQGSLVDITGKQTMSVLKEGTGILLYNRQCSLREQTIGVVGVDG